MPTTTYTPPYYNHFLQKPLKINHILYILSSYPTNTMRKMARREDLILNLDIDLVLIIFSLLLNDNFIDFANFFQIWVPYQTKEAISKIFRNLDWSNIQIHENPWNPLAQHKFSSFIQHCKIEGINHAICYDACKHLLQGEDTENNLHILRQLSKNHSPSYLAFHVFNSIYKEMCREESATFIHQRLKTLHFRSHLQSIVEMLQKYKRQHRGGWNEVQRFTPVGPLCPLGRARLRRHFYIYGWPPTFEEIMNSVCPLCCLQMLWCTIFEEY